MDYTWLWEFHLFQMFLIIMPGDIGISNVIISVLNNLELKYRLKSHCIQTCTCLLGCDDKDLVL